MSFNECGVDDNRSDASDGEKLDANHFVGDIKWLDDAGEPLEVDVQEGEMESWP